MVYIPLERGIFYGILPIMTFDRIPPVDNLPSDRLDGTPLSVGEEILLLDAYIRRATRAWTDNSDGFADIDIIRKIALIAQRCVRNHEPPTG